MKKTIIFCIGLIISSLTNAQSENSNLNNGCEYEQDTLGKIQVKITEEYSNKFSSHNDAMVHCVRTSQIEAANRIDQQIPQCSAHKDDTGYISTTMSAEFMDQFNSYEQAQENCWKLHGYEDTVESQNKDMIVVESNTSTETNNGYPVISETRVHKDDVQQYYIDKQEEEIEQSKRSLKAITKPITSCTQILVPSIQLSLFDAVTNKNVSCKSKAIISDNDYQIELDNINCLGGFLEGLLERPGNYSLRIDAEGYKPWQKNEIIFSANECHIITEELNVYLQPSD